MQLHLPRAVDEVDEGRLPLPAARGDAAGHAGAHVGLRAGLEILVGRLDVRDPLDALVDVRERLDALVTQGIELAAP